MKKVIISLSMLLGGVYNLSAQVKEKIDASNIPAEIHIFVQKHFPNTEIKKAYLDAEDVNNINYDIILKNKTELEFDKKFRLQEIESKKGVTLALIPKDIVKYVSENYPGQIIVEWSHDKEDKEQEVTLKNKTELKFNSRGKFISAEIK